MEEYISEQKRELGALENTCNERIMQVFENSHKDLENIKKECDQKLLDLKKENSRLRKEMNRDRKKSQQSSQEKESYKRINIYFNKK